MKNGELSMQVIVTAILCLIVLIVLIIVFNTQIREAAGKYFGVIIDTGGGLNNTKCVTIVSAGSRKCDTTCDSAKGWRQIEANGGKWSDCQQKLCCEMAN